MTSPQGIGDHFRAHISLVLSVAIITVFSLSSFAAPEPAALADDPAPIDAAAGALTIKGKVTLNGNDTQTGATVLSGSVIATGHEGNALVDLGNLGRVEVRDETAVTLTFNPKTVQVRSHCGDIKITVVSGQVELSQPEVMTIRAGEEKEFDKIVEFLTNGVTEVAVDCDDEPVAAFIWPGLGGITALIILAIGDKGPRRRIPPLSPTQL
jgi:hypothetical protein